MIRVISHVDPVLEAADNAACGSHPGFVDLQVNGFAGVDYNSPAHAPLEEIARSIRAMFSTGVTRFFPTVITGSPEDMLGALRESGARARDRWPKVRRWRRFTSRVRTFRLTTVRAARIRRAGFARPTSRSSAAGRTRRRATCGWSRCRPNGRRRPRYIEQLAREGVVDQHRPHAGDARADRRRGSRRSDAFHASRQRRDAVLPRHPNYIWEQLAEDKLAASFIVDGHPSAGFVPASRPAGQGHRAERAGHRRRDARDVRARSLSPWAKSRSS